MARFQETDTFRTNDAVLLSSRYRQALLAREAGRPGIEAELEDILRRCSSPDKARTLPLVRVAPEECPAFVDDGDPALLERAILSARKRLSRSSKTTLVMGSGRVRVVDLIRGLDELLSLIRKGLFGKKLATAIRDRFDIYRSPGAFGTGEVLFTTYASPVYAGSVRPDGRHRYPLFRNPSRAGLSPRSFDRADIYAGSLAGKKLEIAYLTNRMDEFQIQIEGSGFVRLPSGGFLHLTYSAANGRSYRSLGKAMVKDGLFKPWDIDNLAIRRYFREHPDEERPYLERNPSYVFFDVRRLTTLPESIDLTAQRSVAADTSYFPRGMLAFADTFLPTYDRSDTLTGRTPYRRFVVVQDVGGAIKGAGRIDLYQGQGEDAQRIADTAKEPGALFILLPKGAPLLNR